MVTPESSGPGREDGRPPLIEPWWAVAARKKKVRWTVRIVVALLLAAALLLLSIYVEGSIGGIREPDWSP